MPLFKIKIFLFSVVLSLASCNKQKFEGKKSSDQIQKDSIALLDLVQRQTIDYFWSGAETNSGMARERIHLDNIYPQNDQNVITTGGTGFGLMAILAGVERKFIHADSALTRFEKIVGFLETADRFHGAWPHWLDGQTGKVKPFSPKDNGGDLVETAFLIQGLLTVSEYYKDGNERERLLSQKIEKLYEEVEWNWYTNNKNVLYWHWSHQYQWEMNFPVGGYNECLITYILAAASPTHPITKEVYESGWARDGNIKKDTIYYGLNTVLDHYENDKAPVGPLFWAHYSYLGLNPKGLKDAFADYWRLNQNHALIHYKYAVDNPKHFKEYGDSLWGMTSSYSINGYHGHRPGDDLGVISPTAALSSFPYTPNQSMAVLRNLYKNHDTLIGKYGPYDAFSIESNWYLPRYLAIDQGPIPVMIENYRTGLLWNLFMQRKDVQQGLRKLGFTLPDNIE